MRHADVDCQKFARVAELCLANVCVSVVSTEGERGCSGRPSRNARVVTRRTFAVSAGQLGDIRRDPSPLIC